MSRVGALSLGLLVGVLLLLRAAPCAALPAPAAGPAATHVPVDATPASANHLCVPKADATEQEMQAILDYVCAQPGAGIDHCSAIAPTGAHFEPNTMRAHASWAANAYYEQHVVLTGFSGCFFSNCATLNPMPEGLLFPFSGTAGPAHRLVPRTPAAYGVGASTNISANTSAVFVSDPVTAGYNGLSTAFSLWAARQTVDRDLGAGAPAAGGAGVLCSLFAVLEYDFDGDGQPERTENYNKYYLVEAPQFQDYSQAVGASSVAGKPFGDMANGRVTLTLSNEDGDPACVDMVLMAAQALPSFVLLPYGQ